LTYLVTRIGIEGGDFFQDKALYEELVEETKDHIRLQKKKTYSNLMKLGQKNQRRRTSWG
jgi:hypothetical protein